MTNRSIGYETREEFFELLVGGVPVSVAAAAVGVSREAGAAWWRQAGLMDLQLQMGALAVACQVTRRSHTLKRPRFSAVPIRVHRELDSSAETRDRYPATSRAAPRVKNGVAPHTPSAC